MTSTKRYKPARLASLSFATLLIFSSSFLSLALTTGNVSATTSISTCLFPSAKNETPVGYTYEGVGQTIIDDGDYWPDLYQRYGGSWGVVTSDFNNLTYLTTPSKANTSGAQASDSATISEVWIVAMFQGYYPPINYGYIQNSQLSFSRTDPLHGFNGPFTASGHTFHEYSTERWGLAANITSIFTWTPAMLRDRNLSVKFTCTVTAGALLEMDYVGIYYSYTGDSIVGPSPPSPDSGSFSLSTSGAINVIGIMGLVIVPAAAVWVAKQGVVDKFHVILAAGIIMALCYSLLFF